MVSGKLGLVLVLLVAVALAEEDMERDVLTEDEEGVVEEDMSLYTRYCNKLQRVCFTQDLDKLIRSLERNLYSFQGRRHHVPSVEETEALRRAL